MVKREREASESDSSSPSSSPTTIDPKLLKAQHASTPDAGIAEESPAKKARGKRGPNMKNTPKTAWTAEEEAILQGMLDTIIKSHLWPEVKKDGRLVHRTSYGVQYHAKMMLRQGPKGNPK